MQRHDRTAYVPMVGFRDADAVPGLRDAYLKLRALAAAGGARPAVYDTPSGEPPQIVRCHSLEPDALFHTFAVSTAIHWSPSSLPWRTRELINTVTSGANDCFY